jgi:hypothetical protein
VPSSAFIAARTIERSSGANDPLSTEMGSTLDA